MKHTESELNLQLARISEDMGAFNQTIETASSGIRACYETESKIQQMIMLIRLLKRCEGIIENTLPKEEVDKVLAIITAEFKAECDKLWEQ